MDWNKRLEVQFNVVKLNIEDVSCEKINGGFIITYYYYNKKYRLSVIGGAEVDFINADYIAYAHIINGHL